MAGRLKAPGRPSVTRATPATPEEYAARVDRIIDMMRVDTWVRGKSAKPLAKEWGVEVCTVERMAAEASRAVAREVTDPQKLKEEVSVVLVQNLHRASAAREFKAVASLGDVVTKIVGARAPEKHQHAHVVATYEASPPGDRLTQVREAIAALQAEEAAIVAGMLGTGDDSG